MYKYFHKQNCDIICIQEAHSCLEDEKVWALPWCNNEVYNHGKRDARGVMILFNPSKNIDYETIYKDKEGRMLMVKITREEQSVLLVNIYGPNEDDPTFFESIFKQINNTDIMEYIIAGDFNVVMEPSMDRSDNVCYSPKSANLLYEIKEDAELADIWRIRNPNSKIFSWMRENKDKNKNVSASRINYALATICINNKIDRVKYEYGYKMDHSLFVFNIDFSKHVRGPGYWKFNSLMLHDKEFVNKANEIIKAAPEKYYKSSADKIWECCLDDLGQ